MGMTGVFLYSFLFVHLLGNLGLLAGAERFNKYGYLLLHHLAELIIPAEIALILALLAHAVLAIQLSRENRAARPVAYKVKSSGGRKTLYSMTMMVTGIVILVYIIEHVAHFRYGAVTGAHRVIYDGVEMRDLYKTVMNGFAVWWYALAYVAVLLLIGSHLAHGVQSSFQSLGFNHPKWNPIIYWFSRGYAVLISGGFSFLAIWAYFQGGVP